MDGTLHVFSPGGHSISPASVVDEGSNYRVTLSLPIELPGTGDAILITLQLR